jgi:hypothetical protein
MVHLRRGGNTQFFGSIMIDLSRGEWTLLALLIVLTLKIVVMSSRRFRDGKARPKSEHAARSQAHGITGAPRTIAD